MNYATGYAMNTEDLFLSFPTKKMEMTAKACEELIGNRHKEVIAKKIFKSALNMVLEDIIENNATTRVKYDLEHETIEILYVHNSYTEKIVVDYRLKIFRTVVFNKNNINNVSEKYILQATTPL